MAANPDTSPSVPARLGPNFRLTRRGFGAIVCGLSILTIGVVLGIPEASTAGLLTLGTVVIVGVAGLFRTTRPPKIVVQRIINGRDQTVPSSGDELPVDVVITTRQKTGLAELVEVALDDLVAKRGARSVRLAVRPLAAGTTSTASYRVILRQRGVLRFLPTEWKRFDPLGFSMVTHRVDKGGEIVVGPPLVELPATSIQALALMSPPGVPGNSYTIDPFELREIRPHVTGEDLRRVHWPTSARRNMLMVREPERTRSVQSMPLIVTCDARLGAHDQTLEMALSTTASIVSAIDDLMSIIIITDSGVHPHSNKNDALRLLGTVPREPERGPRLRSAHRNAASHLASIEQRGHILITGPLSKDSGSLTSIRCGLRPFDASQWTAQQIREQLAMAINDALVVAAGSERP